MVQEHTLIGKILGNRYRVLREIGSGGMAWVYLAEDIKENNLVAIKVLYPQFGEDLSYVQRFNREAKLASTLTDPHIVRVLDYGADRDIYYLVMEYVDGKPISTLKFSDRNSLDEILKVMIQVCNGLMTLHSRNIIHRDLKPSNILVDLQGELARGGQHQRPGIVALVIRLTRQQALENDQQKGRGLAGPRLRLPGHIVTLKRDG